MAWRRVSRTAPPGGRRRASAATRSMVSNSSAHALAPHGRGETHRRIVEEGQPVADLLDDLGLAHHPRGNEIPLVDHQHRGPTRLVRVSGDVGILSRDALRGVEDDEGHLTALEALAGHDHRQLLEHLRDPPLAPDARGIDQHVGPVLVEERRVHRIARGAGRRIHEDALRAHHGVHQRRLAHVRPADDGDVHRRLPGRCRRPVGAGARSRTTSSSSATPRPCSAETGHGLAEPQAVQVRR